MRNDGVYIDGRKVSEIIAKHRQRKHWWDYEPPDYVRMAVEVFILVFAATLGGYVGGWIAGSSGRPLW